MRLNWSMGWPQRTLCWDFPSYFDLFDLSLRFSFDLDMIPSACHSFCKQSAFEKMLKSKCRKRKQPYFMTFQPVPPVASQYVLRQKTMRRHFLVVAILIVALCGSTLFVDAASVLVGRGRLRPSPSSVDSVGEAITALVETGAKGYYDGEEGEFVREFHFHVFLCLSGRALLCLLHITSLTLSYL